MARAKFLVDAERCIECNACVTACKNEHEVPWGINRRRVVTINDGDPGERSISVACMHCSDAPCMAVCPVDCFYQTPKPQNPKTPCQICDLTIFYNKFLIVAINMYFKLGLATIAPA